MGPRLFQKPCLLVFKHCSGNATQARACTSNTDLLSSKTWDPVWVREGMRAETTSDERRIHLSHFRYFACQQSPAAAILEVFEEQNGNLRDLYNVMVAMGRSDCALVIEGFLNGTSSGHCCMLATSARSQAGIDRPWNMNGKSTGSPQPGPLGQGSCRRELTKGERLSCSGWCSASCTGFPLHLNSGGRLHRC
ncbi:UNC5C-like protein [Chelonia mydas]|uniref:UNC5C-like protein n=1 Tax=Chelonia mydas TaxID=8469 RepID=M7BK27_CHEMY|nr:UNC5C-like protein [Chelonia mydas]